MAADSYDATADAADPVIAVWRNRPTALAPFQEELLRFVVVTHLGLLAVQYDAALAQAAGQIEETEEEQRCSTFLADSSAEAARELLG